MTMMNNFPVLPDGSSFFTASFPLPKNHWIYEPTGDSPAPWRCGTTRNEIRKNLVTEITTAAKYAIRASTMSGEETDFDPDAMVQNFIVGMVGYWTENGCRDT